MILLDYQGEILNKTRAATLDNLFSPRTGTEIPYVPLQHNMQFSPMFPYKYCISLTNIVYLYGKYTAELPSSDGSNPGGCSRI